MTDREGPTRMVREYESCLGCKYQKMFLFKSGLDPLYDHFCFHPDVLKGIHCDKGEWIGATDHTPNWCPVKKEHES